jgi:hypothetical protein
MPDPKFCAGENAINPKEREHLLGEFCRFGLQLVAVFCLVLLPGCGGRAEVAEQPIAAGGSAEIARDSQGPTITFENTVHDYGQVSPRSKNVCEFKFKNAGTETLTVARKVDSACGCTAIMMAKTDYAPDEEGTIKITYTAGGIPTIARKILVVHSNDRENPQTRLTITAKITPRVAHEPKQLDLQLNGKTTTCPPITLRSLDGKPFSVTGILCTGNSLSADFDPSVSAKEFTIRPKPDVETLQRLPAGYLMFTLTHPECKKVRIRYQARSEFQFVPASIMLYGAKPNMPTLKYVFLSNNHGKDFEIASFSSEQDLVDVLEKTKVPNNGRAGTRYRLKVSVTPPASEDKKGTFADTLSVHLKDGQTLQLDFRGVCATSNIGTQYPPP